jgi:hypothetical protein
VCSQQTHTLNGILIFGTRLRRFVERLVLWNHVATVINDRCISPFQSVQVLDKQGHSRLSVPPSISFLLFCRSFLPSHEKKNVFVTALSDLQPFHSGTVNFLSLPIITCFNLYLSYPGEVKNSIVIHTDNIISPLDKWQFNSGVKSRRAMTYFPFRCAYTKSTAFYEYRDKNTSNSNGSVKNLYTGHQHGSCVLDFYPICSDSSYTIS